MKRIPLKAVLFTLVGLVAAGSLVSNAPTPASTKAPESSNQACTKSGITLVIDFGDENKPVENYCVQNFSGSGWQLFEAAKVLVEGTAEYPQSFVCRIQGVPAKQTEDCLSTPGFATGTWVYYIASSYSGDKNWARSAVGAAMRKPQCGDFDGWRFVRNYSDASASPRIVAKPFRCE